MASSPNAFASRIVAAMREDFQQPMRALAKDMQAEMRDLISVPVQYVPVGSSRPPKPKRIGNKPGPGLTQSPGLGHAVVRSKRGEPPRKEFGNLYKSMTYEVAYVGSGIAARMGSDISIADYAERLEEQMDRPHFETIFRRVQSYAVDRILSRLPQTI